MPLDYITASNAFQRNVPVLQKQKTWLESRSHLLAPRRVSVTRSTSACGLDEREIDYFELFCAQAGSTHDLRGMHDNDDPATSKGLRFQLNGHADIEPPIDAGLRRVQSVKTPRGGQVRAVMAQRRGTSVKKVPRRKLSTADEYGGSMPCLARCSSVKTPKPRIHLALNNTLSLPFAVAHPVPSQLEGRRSRCTSPEPGTPTRSPSIHRKGKHGKIWSSIRNLLDSCDVKPTCDNSQDNSQNAAGCRSAPNSRSSSLKRPRRARKDREAPADSISSRQTIRALDLSRRNSLERSKSLNIDQYRADQDDWTRVRNFAITSKGIVNRGDSFRSRSPSSLRSWGSANSELGDDSSTSDPGSVSPGDTSCPPPLHRVVLLGASGVGKTALISQFRSSETVLDADLYESSEEGPKTTSVSVLLDKREAALEFVDIPPELDHRSMPNVDAVVILYSTTERATFAHALELLYSYGHEDRQDKPVILVANKTDLVRSRQITTKEGKMAAEAYHCKYVEVSATMNIQVDDLLVGVLNQIRLRLVERSRRGHGDGRRSPIAFIGRFLKKQMAVSKSCDNLMVL